VDDCGRAGGWHSYGNVTPMFSSYLPLLIILTPRSDGKERNIHGGLPEFTGIQRLGINGERGN